jgi:drug/metabolite transporter (DMT)-like permease
MDALIKWLSAGYPVIQIAFFRVAFALIPVALLIIGTGGGLTGLRTRRPLAHVARGTIGFGAGISFFTAFAHMPLADAYAIAFAAPLLITALSVPILGELVGWRRWIAIVVGFIGVIVILRPAGATETMLGFGAVMALTGTVLYSIAIVLSRQMITTETNAAIVTYQTLTAMTLSGLALPWYFVMPTASDLLLLAGVGTLGGSATVAMTQSFRMASISILAPFEYTAMVWGVFFGVTLWGDLPDTGVWVGTAIVIASGLYILHRETKLSRSKAQRDR